ncbi:fimbrial protein [Buttiauxella noackiae]|uniref:fimbrial protein n=1 Tax=Buttiauxella noackiae TaxID=82992 RepID=UPI00068DDF55|nr:fimbrial protein [Buttiauxella noackiae]
MNRTRWIIMTLFSANCLMTLTNISQADPVNINITGKIIASACTIDAANSNLNVDLGSIPISTMNQAGNTSPYKIFDLILKDCPLSTTSVTAAFSGELAPGGSTDYNNTGTAQNINVQLKESQSGGNGRFLGPGTTLTKSVAVDHTATFHMGARAIASSSDVMPGTVVSLSQVTFTYQ